MRSVVRKPNWSEQDGDQCQWPKCTITSEILFQEGCNKWIDREGGIQLCRGHHITMSRAILPEVEFPFGLDKMVTIKANEDYPTEKVIVRDWFILNGRMVALVASDIEDAEWEEIDVECLES